MCSRNCMHFQNLDIETDTLMNRVFRNDNIADDSDGELEEVPVEDIFRFNVHDGWQCNHHVSTLCKLEFVACTVADMISSDYGIVCGKSVEKEYFEVH